MDNFTDTGQLPPRDFKDQLRITLVQTNLAWQEAEANLEILNRELSRTGGGTDLFLLPEMFTSAFSVDQGAYTEYWPGQTLDWMLEKAAAYRAALCGSIAVRDKDKRYNRLLFVTPEQQVYTYDKRHLFRMLGEHERYDAGRHLLTVTWRGWRIRPLVCYDLRFPVWSRNTADNTYDLLLYVANWPAARSGHWRTLLQARAIENQACVAGVNRIGRDGKGIDYDGHSMVVDATGEILVSAGQRSGHYSATIKLSDVKRYRERFPAYLDADEFEIK